MNLKKGYLDTLRHLEKIHPGEIHKTRTMYCKLENIGRFPKPIRDKIINDVKTYLISKGKDMFKKQAAKEHGLMKHKGKKLPREVKSLADRIRSKSKVSDEYAYRTAWDIFHSNTTEGAHYPKQTAISGLARAGGGTGSLSKHSSAIPMSYDVAPYEHMLRTTVRNLVKQMRARAASK